MNDFDVSIVISNFDVNIMMSDVNVNIALIVISDVDVNVILGFGKGDYGIVHLQMNCWHYRKHILASIVYYFFFS